MEKLPLKLYLYFYFYCSERKTDVFTLKKKVLLTKQLNLENMGKAINIEYGKIDFENDIIETVTSTRL